MDARGRLKLCDFGSCFAVSEDGHVRTELHVGTPDYMAPEFLAAKRRRGDAFTQVRLEPLDTAECYPRGGGGV
jgi:serine/threonine protein kinase